MGFTGSINSDLRRMLLEVAADRWRDRPVYVGCSGNFVVEAVLKEAGIREIHSNDVSLYSCAIGQHLLGDDLVVTVEDDAWQWLLPYLEPGHPTIATLLMATACFGFSTNRTPYHRRMWKAYREQWDDMHAKTVERVARRVEGMRITSFFAGDVLKHVEACPDDAVFVSFPPTYKGCYESLYKMLDRVFVWEAPEYDVCDDEGFARLTALAQSKAGWATLRDHDVPELADHLVGLTKASERAKPVYFYADGGMARVAFSQSKLASAAPPRLGDRLEGDLRVVPTTSPIFNLLRAEYLDPTIAPAAADCCYLVMVGQEVAGAIGISTGSPGRSAAWVDAYVLWDFAIGGTKWKRLSKLVVAALLSKELADDLSERTAQNVTSIGTTAFTERAVSMKYRGLLQLHKRGEHEGRKFLNYMATVPRWTLAEAMDWWMTTQEKHHR